MDKTQEGLKKDYLPTAVSKEYKDLFNKVCDLTRTKAINNPAKKLQPPISSPEFCEAFFAFLKPKQSNWQLNVEFKRLITKELRRSYDTFMKWQSGGIPEKGNYSHTCFCISAQVHETKVEEHLAKFLDEWVDGYDPDISLPGLVDFKQDIQELRAKYNSSDSQYSFEEELGKQGIDRVKGEEKWLDPYNFDELPLVGREKEIELLDNFIKTDGQFKIWAIAGPSGSGKTRLASQWAYDSKVLKDWNCRVLHKEDRAEPEKWASWTPDKPTLIIIDYLYGFEEVFLKLMGRRLEPTGSKVRLLLLDHVFSKPLHSDKRWGFSGDGSSLNRNEKYFYDLKPLDLSKTLDQAEIIRKIIAHRAKIGEKSSQVEEAHEYLLETQGAYHPLFAALVGDAIKSGKDFTVWSRRELINYYLSGERLPWIHDNDEGRWASYFIAVATARRGVAYKDLEQAASNCKSTPEHFAKVEEICQKIITDDNTTTLKPFEPDILGESFFLKFLKFLENSPRYQIEFQQVFIAGDEETLIKDAISSIAFIQRLTRNVLNDDQSLEETQELWDTLFNFINPSKFNNAESTQWALTAGIIDIVGTLQSKFPEERLITLLNQAEPTVLYRVHSFALLRDAVWYTMRYFELISKLKKIKPELAEEMFALFGRFTENNIYGETALIFASYHGFNEMIDVLIDHGADIEKTFIGGTNALILATLFGQTGAVKCLLNSTINIHAADNKGRTALIWASLRDQVEVVRLLLNKGAEINAADNEGRTALFAASNKGHIEVAKLLLDNGADIHAIDNENNTPLIWACDSGYTNVIELLLDNGANIHAIDNLGRTALSWASINGHAEAAKLLINEGANIHATDNEGYTALTWASLNGHVDAAKLLIDEGADIHAVDNEGHTALSAASIKGQVDAVKLLIDEGSNIHAIDNEGSTALIWACNDGHVETVKLLIDKGAEINAADNKGHTALIWSSAAGHIDVIRLLLDEGANVNAANNQNHTALFAASAKGHTYAVKLLLDKGAEIDAADSEGHTALFAASNKGHIEVAKLLLDNGADIHAIDNLGRTALILAIIENHTETARLLINKGVKVDSADNEGRTALMEVSYNGQAEIAKLLIDEGTEINTTDNKGLTALLYASLNDQIDMLKLLLEKGANIHAINNDGHTALFLSSANGYIDVVKLLLDNGANIHAIDNNGHMALFVSSVNGHIDVVKLLLEKGANIHAIDNEGYTALFFACFRNHIEIVKLLLERGAQTNIINIDGDTALSIAIEKGHKEIANLLVEYGAQN